jgi:soluble lytic murein transglycosylase
VGACLVATSLACAVAIASAEDARPTLAEVAALVARHHDAAALAMLERAAGDAPPPVDQRYLRGRLFERLERFAEAADDFAAVEGSDALPSTVRRDASERRAMSLARAGRCAEARPLLAPLAERRGSRGAPARALAAECALAAGDLEAAEAALRAVVAEAAGPVDVFAARLELAEVLVRRGNEQGAAEELRAALRDRSGHPDVALAEARLEALGATPTEGAAVDPVAQAEADLLARHAEDALGALERAPEATTRRERAERLHVRGMALYALRTRYAEAAEVLADAARLGGQYAIDDAFHAARALSRAGENRKAIAAYRRLIRAHPIHPRASEAAYLAAWLRLHHGGARADRDMVRFVSSRHAAQRPGDARKALWLLGFHYFEAGRKAAAIRYLERYRAQADSPLETSRALYWLGRAHEARHRRPEAITAYTSTLHHEPLGWYAQLAHRRLVALGEAEIPPFPGAAPERGASSEEAVEAIELPAEAVLFHRLGLVEDAIDRLRSAESSIREAAPRGQGLSALLTAYTRLGAVNRPFRLAIVVGGRFAEPPTRANRALWEAAYPRPYAELVTDVASRHGLEPEHIYATMRQESAFDPSATSPVGAMGLLQLMPGTASRAAERLGVPFRRAMLYDPEWNVRLGAAEMQALVERFHGQLPLVIAAYNAGSHRVDGWLARTGRVETDRFVEHIPYDETRNYVRRVMSHFARYRYLQDPGAAWSVPIPEMVSPGG